MATIRDRRMIPALAWKVIKVTSTDDLQCQREEKFRNEATPNIAIQTQEGGLLRPKSKAVTTTLTMHITEARNLNLITSSARLRGVKLCQYTRAARGLT